MVTIKDIMPFLTAGSALPELYAVRYENTLCNIGDGGVIQDIGDFPALDVNGLAFNPANGNLYMIASQNSSQRGIYLVNENTPSTSTRLFITDSITGSLVVHNGRFYYADGAALQRAEFDGSNKINLGRFSIGNFSPINGLASDGTNLYAIQALGNNHDIRLYTVNEVNNGITSSTYISIAGVKATSQFLGSTMHNGIMYVCHTPDYSAATKLISLDPTSGEYDELATITGAGLSNAQLVITGLAARP